jgi:hypothetical protein
VYAGHPSAGTHVVAARHGRVYLALDDDRRGGCAPVPITAVVFLRESADEIAMVRTPAAAAMPDLWALSFRLPTNQARAQAFGQLTELATVIPIWNLYRPVRFASLDATIARIVEVCQ